jgi:hypothetical protein
VNNSLKNLIFKLKKLSNQEITELLNAKIEEDKSFKILFEELKGKVD